MTFSFYRSLQSVPSDLREVAQVHRLSGWQQFTQLELPCSVIGLVWNSMMSMAGGWFFLTVTESFVLGKKDFRLPGVGAYMSVAIAEGDVSAMVFGVVAMIVMIVAVDWLLWRPIVVWSQKFKLEETEAGEAPVSSVLQPAPVALDDVHARRGITGKLDQVLIAGMKLRMNNRPIPLQHGG
jgi:NitT/TauT family transport system permease protein